MRIPPRVTNDPVGLECGLMKSPLLEETPLICSDNFLGIMTPFAEWLHEQGRSNMQQRRAMMWSVHQTDGLIPR